MPVSANSTLNYTRDELITMAMRLAGVLMADQTPQAADVSMAAGFMNLELMNLQAEGVILRATERPTPLTLVAGTASYTLPASTLDVEVSANDVAGTIVPTPAGSESIVTVMSRSEYLSLADKTVTTTGRPSRVYIERSTPITLTFWPVPDAHSASFRYVRSRLLADMDAGNVNVDLNRKWLQWVTYATATQIALAKSLPLDRVGYLRNEAERQRKKLVANDAEIGIIRMRIRHRVPRV